MTVSSFNAGCIAVGGSHGYIEIFNSSGDHIGFTQPMDINNLGQNIITGLTFRPSTGHLFATTAETFTQDNVAHDIDWIPDDSGLLIAYVPSPGVLKFRKVNFDGTSTGLEWTPDVEDGWFQQPVKISIACDAQTVYYTMSGKVVKRYDLEARENLTDYQTLDDDSPYRFGAIKVVWTDEYGDARDIVAAMTVTGDGPFHGLCLDSNTTSFWADEINPTNHTYKIKKYNLLTRALEDTVTTKARPLEGDEEEYLNDITYSLACNYNACQIFPGISRFDVNANQVWFVRSSSGV